MRLCLVTFRRMNFCHGICSRLSQSALFSNLQESATGEAHGCEPIEFPSFTRDTFTLSTCWKPLLHVSSSKPKSFKRLGFRFKDSLRQVTHVTCSRQIYHLVSSFVSSNRKKQKKSWMEVIGVRSYVIGVMFFLQQTALRLQIKQEHQFHLKRGSS